MVNALVVIQSLHGIVGALAVASCFHPVVTIRFDRVPGHRVRLSAWLAAGLTTASFCMGLWLYVDYREVVKPWLLINAPEYHAYGFETKEALGYFTCISSWGGAGLLHFGRRSFLARRAAKTLFKVAFAGGLITLILGIVVASVKGL